MLFFSKCERSNTDEKCWHYIFWERNRLFCSGRLPYFLIIITFVCCFCVFFKCVRRREMLTFLGYLIHPSNYLLCDAFIHGQSMLLDGVLYTVSFPIYTWGKLLSKSVFINFPWVKLRVCFEIQMYEVKTFITGCQQLVYVQCICANMCTVVREYRSLCL